VDMEAIDRSHDLSSADAPGVVGRFPSCLENPKDDEDKFDPLPGGDSVFDSGDSGVSF
jgi:hypothetical protein